MTEKHKAKSIRGISRNAWNEFETLRKCFNLNQGDTFGKLVEIATNHLSNSAKLGELSQQKRDEAAKQIAALDQAIKNLQFELLEQRSLFEVSTGAVEKRLIEITERSTRHSKKLKEVAAEVESLKPKSLVEKMGFRS